MDKTPGIDFPANGRNVYQENFNYEQEAKSQAIVDRTGDFYSHGIQVGGAVTSAGSGLIEISPTLAYDPQGRRIQIEDPVQEPVADGSWKVGLRHAFAQSPGNDPDDSGLPVEHRSDSYEVIVAASLDAEDVPLFDISVTSGTVTVGTDLRVKRDMTVSGDSEFKGNIIVRGKATFEGTQTNVNTQDMEVEDNIILLNKGDAGSGVSLGKSGIRIDRGALQALQFIFDESDDRWKVGADGAEQSLALLAEVIPLVQKAAANGVASLGADGKVPAAQLPDSATRIGQICLYMTSTPPVPVVPFNRAALSRASYSDLWNWVQAHSEVYDATGAAKQKYGPGDGSTTFDLPDLRGLALRMAGVSSAFQKANGNYYDGGSLLEVLLDAFQGHRITAEGTPTSLLQARAGYGAGALGATTDTAAGTFSTSYYGPYGANASHGDPRVGAETRGVTIAIGLGVFYE